MFPQAPLRSRTAGFPRSGSDLGFSSAGLSAPRGNLSTGIHTPLSRRFTYQLVLLSKTGYYPVLLSGNQTPLVSEPPSAQSPFASRRRYRCEGGVQRLLEGHYPFIIAHTDSCARPLRSLHPWFHPLIQGLCRLLPAPAAQWPFPSLSLSTFPACLDPYPGRFQGAFTRFFPQNNGLPQESNGSASGIYLNNHFR
jgi:hypothetical protein